MKLLTQLLEEQLDHDQAAVIIAHVETCTACQERLKQLDQRIVPFMKWGYFGDDGRRRGLSPLQCENAFTGPERPVEAGIGTDARFSRKRSRGRISLPSKATSSWQSSDTAEWASSTRRASID